MQILRKLFNSGRTKNISFRIRQLQKLRETIHEKESQIFEALKQDLGKPPFESYASEIGHCLKEIDFTLKNLERWAAPEKVPTDILHFGGRSKIHREPKGIVLVIGPYNYPFQLTMGPLIAAVAAGNCVVVKPSELVPNCAAIIHKIIAQAFQQEFVKCVQGGVEETQKLLKERFDHIFFTGGINVGKIILQTAASHLTPVTLELGGKSPCIINKDVPIEQTARRVIWGKFYNAGQTCVAPDYLLVHRTIKEEFITACKKAITDFYGTNPAESKDYGRLVNERHFQRVMKLISGDIACGGQSNPQDRYIAPTLINNVKLSDPIMAEEIFGPVLPILSFETAEEVVETVAERPYPLALYCFTNNHSFKNKIISEIQFGGGCINDTLVHLSSTHLPFGGIGPSGMGAYHGKTGFDLFSHQKSIMEKTNWFDIELRYPPYSDGKLGLVRKFWK